jgi:type I restriction enzyme, S subunit
MTAWPEVPLGEVLTSRKDVVVVLDGVEYKRLTIRLDGRGIAIRDVVFGEEIGTKTQFRVEQGQLLLSKIDARNGAFGVIPPACDSAIITGNFWAFTAAPDRLSAAYANYLTKTPLFLDFCIRASSGTTNRLYLQEDRFLSQVIPLPPLAEQRRIVARIEELAALLHEARALHHQAVTEADVLAQSTTTKVLSVGEALGWRRARFGESSVLEVIDGDRGKNYPQKTDFAETGDCLFLNTSNVRKGTFSFSRCDFITREKDAAMRKGKVTRGDVILTTRGTLGNFAHYDGTVPYDNMRINSGMVILRPSPVILLPQYLRVVLSSPSFVDRVAETLSGSAQSQLPIKNLARIDFFLPSLDEQRRIAAELDALQAKVDELKRLQAETQAELDALLPSILDRAFKGEL